MHYWRLLLLAFLAAIQPIASFTERNLVDGLQECCDRQSPTLLRDSRHGNHRFSKSTTDDHRLDQRETLREERRYEVRKPILTRHSSDRLLLDTPERNTRQLTRYSQAENSLERITVSRGRFSSAGNAPQGSVKDTRDIDIKINRERVTREHGRDSFESYSKISRDERRITRLENERYSRISRDSQRVTRSAQDNTREIRRIWSTNDLESKMNDGTRAKISNSKQNNRDMAREQNTERRQSLILSELRSEIDDNRERQSPDRHERERNNVSRRSRSLEAKIIRVSNLREDSRENIRDDIRESRELIQLRRNKRSGKIHQQRDVSQVLRDRTMSVRSADERQQERDDLSRATRTSDRRSSFMQNINRASDRSRIVNMKGIRENARHSRSRDIENSRLERDITDFNERFAKNRQEIIDPKTRSTSISSEKKQRLSSNLRGRTYERRAQESRRVDTERFISNRENTDVERWSAGVTEKENKQFYANRQELMFEERSRRQNNVRILRKQQDIRSNDKNERISIIHKGIRIDKRSFRVANHKNGNRLAEIRQDFSRDGRLSTAPTVTRAQNEQLSQIRQEFIKYEEILNRQDITRIIDNRQDEVKNIRSSRNRQTKNVVRRSIEASHENHERPQTRNIERRLPSAIREGNQRFSQYRYEIRNHEKRSLVASQQELSSGRIVVRYNKRFSRKTNRMENERVSRNHREVRSDERISQDSRENKDRLSNRQENRKNERYSRLDTRDDRDVRKDTWRLKEKQTSRSYDSEVDRIRSENSRENVLSRSHLQHSTETIGRDISRTRNLMDREFVSELRITGIVRSREITNAINLTKMQFEQPIFVVNWQIVLYTLQGIYLCSFIMQMMADNTKNTTKSRRLSWMSLPSQNLIKLD